MNIAENASQYDWQTWGLGVFRSFISGGSAAMVAGLTTMGIAPGTFNLTSSVGNTLKLTGIMFLFQGGYRMFEFLTLHGAPDRLQQQLDTAAAAAKQTQQLAGKTADAVAKAQDIAPEAVKKSDE